MIKQGILKVLHMKDSEDLPNLCFSYIRIDGGNHVVSRSIVSGRFVLAYVPVSKYSVFLGESTSVVYRKLPQSEKLKFYSGVTFALMVMVVGFSFRRSSWYYSAK